MNNETTLAQALRWREARAAEEAPPAPRASRLLALLRPPWWERCPARFPSLLDQLESLRVRYGHAMVAPRPASGGHPVPALWVTADAEQPVLVEVRYFALREGRLRLRFQLLGAADLADAEIEVTFIADDAPRPVWVAPATAVAGGEYRIDAVLPPACAEQWGAVRVTDRMPFRLILRPVSGADGAGGE